MNIVQVCYKYPPFFSGYGKQLHTVNIKLISRVSVDITVITAYGEKAEKKEEGNLSIKPFFKNIEEKGLFHYYVFSLMCFFRYLVTFLKADVIHVVKAGPELIFPVFFGKILGKRVIIKVAQDDLECLLPKKVGFFRSVRRGLIKQADCVIALSQKIYDEALSLGVSGSLVQKIPNSIDFERFNFTRGSAEQRVIKNERRYIYVGAISKRKGVDLILESLNVYQGQPIELSFVGPLYDVRDFEKKISSINKKGVVKAKYYGEINNPEVVLREHDCLILPSYNEGMPNVVLEAAASGLYVILSDIAVHRELVEVFKGECFKVGDACDLTVKINSFNGIEFPVICRELQSKVAEERFSSETISIRYWSLYKSLCAG